MAKWESRAITVMAGFLIVCVIVAVCVLGAMPQTISGAGGEYSQEREAAILTAIARLEEKVAALQTSVATLIQQGIVTTQQHLTLIQDMNESDSAIRSDLSAVGRSLAETREVVAGLTVKAGMVGLLGGIIPSAGALMLYAVQKKRNGNGDEKARKRGGST